MKEPVDHIRRPKLPWRSDAGVTECGMNAASVNTLSREDYFSRLKDMGQQRTAMLTCMTCGDTCRRWGDWESDPRKALAREIEWEVGWAARSKRGEQLRDELLAIAAMIEAHREEFDAHVNASIGRRAWLEQKAALAATKANERRNTPRRRL